MRSRPASSWRRADVRDDDDRRGRGRRRLPGHRPRRDGGRPGRARVLAGRPRTAPGGGLVHAPALGPRAVEPARSATRRGTRPRAPWRWPNGTCLAWSARWKRPRPGTTWRCSRGCVRCRSRSSPWRGPRALVLAHDAHAPGHGAVFLPDTGVLVAGDMCSDVEIPLLDAGAADGDPFGRLPARPRRAGGRRRRAGRGARSRPRRRRRGVPAAGRRGLRLPGRDRGGPGPGGRTPRRTRAAAWLRAEHDRQRALGLRELTESSSPERTPE